MNTDEAQAVQLAGGQQVLIPFGENAHLVWTRTNGQTAAVGLVRQDNKTLNISPTGEERIVRFLPVQKVEKLLAKLRQKPEFQQFEGKLAQKGKRMGKIRALFDETNKIAILGIASEGDDKKIAHQVRIKVKADKDDEPEDDAEPAIQATACGQATGEAVPEGARMQVQMYDAGEGGDLIGSSYDASEGRDYETYICISQWGYSYNCLLTTPRLQVSPSSISLPFVILPASREASFVVWNYGGGKLQGTVTVSAPFSIVSGSSFSLAPGQPQEVIVRFTPVTSGVFSQNATITSNGGNQAIPIAARALTFEEYLDLMVAAHNAALQQGLERAIYLQDDTKGLALYGFPQISRSQLQGMWENFNQLTAPSLPSHIAQGIALLENIPDEQWRQWLWSLVVAERAGRFDEEYNRLLPLGLSTYIQGYQLLTNSNTEQAKAQLRAYVQQLAATGADNIDSALAILEQISNTVRVLVWKIIKRVFGPNPPAEWEQVVDDFVRAYEGARNVAYPTAVEKLQFDLDIFKILDFLANNSMMNQFPRTALAAMMGLFNILQGLAGYGQPFPFDGAPRTTEERKALIRVAAQAIDNGWVLWGIQFIPPGAPHNYFPLLLRQPAYQLQNGRIVNAVFGIGFFQTGPGFDPNRVLQWVDQAIQGFNRIFPAHLNFRMIGAVMVGATSISQISGMIGTLRDAYWFWDGAIFVVWVDASGKVWFVCIGQGCNLLSPSQQQREACMLAGRSPDCGAQHWYGGGTQDPPSSPAVQITP